MTFGKTPRPWGTAGDREMGDLLRRALSGEAGTVEASPDALGRIRERIDRRRARWWLPLPGSLRVVAVTAVAAAVAAAVVVGLGTGLPHSGTTGLSGTGGVAGNGPAGGRPVLTANLPVYYLGPASAGGRLYREYHRIPVADGSVTARIEAAVGAMLGLPASDPDYRSPWPAGARVAGASVEGGTASVDLTGAATDDVDADTARMALEQLVWTATAASVPPGQTTGLTAVRLSVNGHLATALWGVEVPDQPLHRRPAVDVLAPVWVIDPQQGATEGHDFTVNLAGIVPEATMRLRIRDAGGTVVNDQSVHLSAGAPQTGQASVKITGLPTGTYTVEGYLVSERDGSEQWSDDHRFTVG
ncbi:GerMN domain-containing protein [Rugosimonospora africana]|uniref:GerMN domain-containing protein n=1 Tax=Rugosimonospora africana TaxID=556532 RepID=A0A8J3VT60_9ACTN|nr:GerMN domain-containing protein [Rugosimonospora africana]GIH17306.1 hypothetical protein Raf01_54780 [Rugosimonospora africana]